MWSFRNRAALPPWVPKVSCVFFLVARSGGTASFPLTRASTMNVPSGGRTGP